LVLRNIPHKTCRGENKAELGEDTDLLAPLSHRTRDLLFVSIPVIVIATHVDKHLVPECAGKEGSLVCPGCYKFIVIWLRYNKISSRL